MSILIVFGISGCDEAPVVGNHQSKVALNTSRSQYSLGDTLVFSFSNGLDHDIMMDVCEDETIFSFDLWQDYNWKTYLAVNDDCPADRIILRIVPPLEKFDESYPLINLKTSFTGPFRIVLPYVVGDSAAVVYSNSFSIIP
ncbi:MAG: hypothetical protein JSW54_07360 [Fidelibacterota bacterium]|nr:MAG: hypothetical protein JSW54_07360 [Candidatus Neomarinimicrobiota bacterium]